MPPTAPPKSAVVSLRSLALPKFCCYGSDFDQVSWLTTKSNNRQRCIISLKRNNKFGSHIIACVRPDLSSIHCNHQPAFSPVDIILISSITVLLFVSLSPKFRFSKY